MIFQGWRLLLFALVAAAGMAVLASMGVPESGEREVDRYSGRRVFAARGVAGVLADARAQGDARKAIPRIVLGLKKYANHSALARAHEVLRNELSERPPLAPDAEEAQAIRPHAETAAALRRLEADDGIGAETEAFFAPLARWPEERDATGTRPDERAARLALPAEEPGPLLAMARLFHEEKRSRSRLRWLLRAYEAFPRSPSARDALVSAYLEQGRLREALMVLGAAVDADPGDLSLWKRRAEIAGWLSFPHAEREARARIVAEEDSDAERERLIQLCEFAGEPEAGAVHAERLAEKRGDTGSFERALFLLLDGGRVDEAIAYCERRIERGGEAGFWRRKIVQIAVEDLRVDRAIRELRILASDEPNGEAEKQLEGILRRRDRKEELALLLDARLRRHPEDAGLARELLRLHYALGHRERCEELLDARLRQPMAPRTFFENLAEYRQCGMKGLEARALDMARSEALLASDLPHAAEALRPHLGEAPWRDVARALAERFPGEPESKALLLELLEHLPDDAARAAEAERLARAHPGDRAMVRAWIDRASWAGALESEIAARERWAELEPDDDDNRRSLGDLLSAARRPEDAIVHWERLAEREGPGGDAALRLVDVLFAAQRLEEAMRWLERRAALPETSNEDRLRVAESLFGNELLDRALPFYVAVLEREPLHPVALLRAGQIRAWTNDPNGAIPYLERRLLATDEETHVARFYLGEAYWSVRRDGDAAREHAAALAEIEAIAEPTVAQRTMRAKILSRLGRIADARPIYDALLADDPENEGLLLDYADALASIDLVGDARPLIDRARAIDPAGARGMRLDGQAAIREGRHADAARILRESLALHGPDAGVEADLGRALELGGEWRPAVDAYGRSLALQPDNRDLERAVHDLKDVLSDLFVARLEFARAGDDQTLLAEAAASHLFDGDRTRAAASVAFEWLSGPAAAAGGAEVESFLSEIAVSAARRFGDADWFGGGVGLYPGAEGDFPAGLWAGAAFTNPDPFREVHLRLHFHELWKEPAAAAGLGGRSSGASLGGQAEFGSRFWAAAEAGYDLLSISEPAEAEDGRLTFQAIAGCRLSEGRFAHANRFRADRTPFEGILGPPVEEAPPGDRRAAIAVWGSYFGIRLSGDPALPALLPVGESFDYLTLHGRGDFHLARGLGAKVEAYAGGELNEGTLVWGLEAGITFRRRDEAELRLNISVGQAIGRGDSDALAAAASVGILWRW